MNNPLEHLKSDQKVWLVGLVAVVAYALYVRAHNQGANDTPTTVTPSTGTGAQIGSGDIASAFQSVVSEIQKGRQQDNTAMATLVNTAAGNLSQQSKDGFTAVAEGIRQVATGEAAAFKAQSEQIKALGDNQTSLFDKLTTFMTTTFGGFTKAFADQATLLQKNTDAIGALGSKVDHALPGDAFWLMLGTQSAASCFVGGSADSGCLRSKAGVDQSPFFYDSDVRSGVAGQWFIQHYGDCYNAGTNRFDLACIGKKLGGQTTTGGGGH